MLPTPSERRARPHAARAPMAASNGRRSRPIPVLGLAYAINLHQPMTYTVDSAPYPQRQAVARRRLQQ